VFRIEPKQLGTSDTTIPEESLNTINELFYGRLSTRKDLLFTQTVLNGVFCIRFAVGARTQNEHIDKAFEILTHEARFVVESWKGSAVLGLAN
jgi:aromatic-L-amino-acid/L-tryptophan decarboxylase